MNKYMKIEVLGSGCPSCHKLFELTEKAVKELNLTEEVAYVTDIQKIIEMGVMQVPVLAIDGKPVMTGATDDIEKVKSLITGHDKLGKPEDGNASGCACGGNC
jgi:small redox-active disulfide protein 2